MSLSIAEISRMHKDFIYKHLNEMEQQLLPSSDEDQELVRRAVFSVRNKSVIFERYVPFSQNLYTVVHDVKSPNVTIEFESNTISCTCPASGLCRHQLAVLLSLYQYFDSVQDWTSNWRAKKSIQMSTLASNRSPESWTNLVNEVMRPHLVEQKKIEGYAIMTVAEIVRTRLNRYTPFEREYITLFKLYTELSMFINIFKQNATSSYQDSNQQYYIEYYADKTIEKLETYANEVASQASLFAMEPFFEALQEMIFEFVHLQSNYPTIQLKVYLILWNKLLLTPKRIEKELASISLTASKYDLPNNNLLSQPMRTLFYALLQEKTNMKNQLSDIHVNQIEFYLTIVSFLKKQDSIYVSDILKAVLPHLQQFLNEVLAPSYRQNYATLLDQLFEEISLTDEEEMMLYSSFGKYGILPFSNYLLRKKRYEEWASFHLLYPTSYTYLETCGLKEVLDSAPSTTLPVFHHFAMEELAQKSRMNYKQAVRIWKAMRSAAKKAGKTAFFEQYMDVIKTDYKRLRALQEELDKANI